MAQRNRSWLTYSVGQSRFGPLSGSYTGTDVQPRSPACLAGIQLSCLPLASPFPWWDRSQLLAWRDPSSLEPGHKPPS